MLNDIRTIFNTSISLEQVFSSLLIALICGMLISVFYRFSYQGPNYTPTFVQSMVLLSMITALVIMVIGNNLARAFGLVGAMSIIRFRTAVKDTQDIVFIFFSLTVGMAAGVGLRFLALGATIFIGTVLLIMAKTRYATPRKSEFLLQLHARLEEEDQEDKFRDILYQYCKDYRLVNMQALGPSELFELTYYLTLRNKEETSELVRRLNKLPAVDNVRFFFDEQPV